MSFLLELLDFLGAALVVVPICKRLGLSAVLGYLAAGLVIGPPGLQIITGDTNATLHFAELGVVLLLFVIGLELLPKRLWVMRHLVFGLGSLQVGLTTLAISGTLLLLDFELPGALLLGFALALSSTAFVLQLLGEQQKLTTPHGRAAFGTLLLQDLAVVPGLALVTLLDTARESEESGIDPWLVLAVLAGTVVARFLLRPLLRVVAATNIQELFTAAALALVVGAALAMESAGLSMGLGAFAAGMLVADSQYRHQLETDVMPFKGLLLGLFFIAIGMLVNVELLFQVPLMVLGLTLAFMVLKAAIIWPLCRAQGLNSRESLRAAVVLAQGGEFAFVLLAAGSGAQLVSQNASDIAVLVVILSMALTPVAVAILDHLLKTGKDEREFDEIVESEEDDVVIIAGFGRVGQIVGRVLTTQHIPFTALDIDPSHVDFVRKFGNDTYYGDATRLDVLQAAGLARARAVLVAVDPEDTSVKIVDHIKTAHPGVLVMARAHTRHHELALREAGVDFVLRDTLLSSLAIATELLVALGIPRSDAESRVTRFREHDAETLLKQAQVFGDDEQFRQASMTAVEELKQIFDRDAESAIAQTQLPGLDSDKPEDAPASDR